MACTFLYQNTSLDLYRLSKLQDGRNNFSRKLYFLLLSFHILQYCLVGHRTPEVSVPQEIGECTQRIPEEYEQDKVSNKMQVSPGVLGKYCICGDSRVLLLL